MWKHVLAAVVLASFAPGCGSVQEENPDAGATPDADPAAPDADPTAPDADPAAPDADPAAPDASPPGPMCGGPTGALCASDEFCEYSPDSCGLMGETGVCLMRPMGCPDVYLPVCGCDNMTYGNACEAHAAGQDVLYEGECGSTTCGGFTGMMCNATSFCDWTPDSCGSADETGVCRPRPGACPGVYDPVCGCDNMTYSNECVANASGQDIIHTGMCP